MTDSVLHVNKKSNSWWIENQGVQAVAAVRDGRTGRRQVVL